MHGPGTGGGCHGNSDTVFAMETVVEAETGICARPTQGHGGRR